MSRLRNFRNFTVLVLLVSLALIAVAGWLTRDTWLPWYYLHGLKHASEQDREIWIERVASLDTVAVPGLVNCLKQDDPKACENARLALARLSEKWGAHDKRGTELLDRLSSSFESFSFPGQQAVLKLVTAQLLADENASLEPALHTVQVGIQSASQEVRGTGYELLSVLVRRDRQTEHFSKYRELVRRGLKEEDPLLRARAVRAAEVPEVDLQDNVVPLLHDRSAEVRRAAMLALGSAGTVVHDDDLLPWLNDEDPEVCRLCEVALQGRGISRENIRLARMITHPQHSVRLDAIRELMAQADRDPTEWYRRLSRDPSPSVQVAALRAARWGHVDLHDRIEEMVRTDQSDTVRQLAAYYLSEK